MGPNESTGGMKPGAYIPVPGNPSDFTPVQILTYGQKAVGLNFNPSNDPTVQEIKVAYAGIIDLLMAMPCGQPSERMRLVKIAITEAQTAQMWAVKAATWSDKE